MFTGEILREAILRPIVISALSKDLQEQLKHVQKTITNLDGPKSKIIATMKRYYVDKPDTTYAQFQVLMRKNEAEKLQQPVFVNYKLDELLSFLDLINSV